MKIRNLVLQAEAKHRFALTRTNSPDFKDQDLFQILVMSCSCKKWKTRRAVNVNEVDDGYSTILTQEWMAREQMHHLLDQEVPT
jgi:hypothetical protein